MKSRVFLFFLLISFLFTTTAMAAPKPVIKADTTSFDVGTGQYLLKGNVTVQVNNRLITAGEAKVSIWSMEVWGSGGITLTQDDIYFNGDSIYVSGSQSTANMTGNITFKRGDLTITANEAQYNWRTKQGVFSGNVNVVKGADTRTADTATYNVETSVLE